MLRHAAIYGLGLFAAGFVLGTVRVVLITPRSGELAAVLLELPVMLTFAWFWAGRLVRRATGGGAAHWLGAGLAGIIVLILCEAGLAMTVFAQSLGAFMHSLVTVPGLYGLVAQIVSGVLPALHARLLQRGLR